MAHLRGTMKGRRLILDDAGSAFQGRRVGVDGPAASGAKVWDWDCPVLDAAGEVGTGLAGGGPLSDGAWSPPFPRLAKPLRPAPPVAVPTSTVAVAHAVFRRGNPCLRLRDALGPIFMDQQCAALFPGHGQPAEAPWRLAFVCCCGSLRPCRTGKQRMRPEAGPTGSIRPGWSWPTLGPMRRARAGSAAGGGGRGGDAAPRYAADAVSGA